MDHLATPFFPDVLERGRCLDVARDAKLRVYG
jgi:hypothetical protein